MKCTRTLVLILLSTTACKVAEGDRCVCADDCRSGLVCAVGGEVLEGDSCSPGGVAEGGICLPEDEIPQGQDPLDQPDVFFADLGGSRRDFEPEPPDPDDGSDPTGTDPTGTDRPSTGTDSTDTDSTDTSTTATVPSPSLAPRTFRRP